MIFRSLAYRVLGVTFAFDLFSGSALGEWFCGSVRHFSGL